MTRPKRDVNKLAGLLTIAAEAGRPVSTVVTSLPVTLLGPGAGQPRRDFDPVKLEQLTSSIREHGVLQPLLVRSVGDRYEIVAGERRWRAAQAAGLQDVPVLVREIDAEQAQQFALIENLQRENLNAIDEVDAKLALVALTLGLSPVAARNRLTQMLRERRSEQPSEQHEALEQLFSVLGETWTSFTKNKLRILNWPPAVLKAVRAGLPFTVAGVIVTATPGMQADLIEQAQAGAGREALRKIVRETRVKSSALKIERSRVASVLLSEAWFRRLDAKRQQALQDWLDRMPESLKEALAEGDL
ncbi:ParB/RepB/Spo0J family partition protein [Deinococcus detaillensis]|uniref:ParB/RepB/Spo0J family partition protein n=1 Tax=Deinococcus detaillensis TaxID=2592048 RepID=A0A553UZ72_9DEIO|nr:ParB/RepB/Spo0J family partition protein [Deinococcus detaillensis]TSA85498.1 ParB/RepB/Spo0J family partition protein [Deinococcus detaillensis]